MFQDLNKSTQTFLTVLFIGSAVAVGQAFLLHHELTGHFPYNAIDAGMYAKIGTYGLFIAPICAMLGGLLFSFKRLWLAALIPVISCPLLFAAIYKAAFTKRTYNGYMYVEWCFNGKTPWMASQDFYTYAFTLAIIGSIVGASFVFLLLRLTKTEKLA